MGDSDTTSSESTPPTALQQPKAAPPPPPPERVLSSTSENRASEGGVGEVSALSLSVSERCAATHGELTPRSLQGKLATPSLGAEPAIVLNPTSPTIATTDGDTASPTKPPSPSVLSRTLETDQRSAASSSHSSDEASGLEGMAAFDNIARKPSFPEQTQPQSSDEETQSQAKPGVVVVSPEASIEREASPTASGRLRMGGTFSHVAPPASVRAKMSNTARGVPEGAPMELADTLMSTSRSVARTATEPRDPTVSPRFDTGRSRTFSGAAGLRLSPHAAVAVDPKAVTLSGYEMQSPKNGAGGGGGGAGAPQVHFRDHMSASHSGRLGRVPPSPTNNRLATRTYSGESSPSPTTADRAIALAVARKSSSVSQLDLGTAQNSPHSVHSSVVAVEVVPPAEYVPSSRSSSSDPAPIERGESHPRSEEGGFLRGGLAADSQMKRVRGIIEELTGVSTPTSHGGSRYQSPSVPHTVSEASHTPLLLSTAAPHHTPPQAGLTATPSSLEGFEEYRARVMATPEGSAVREMFNKACIVFGKMVSEVCCGDLSNTRGDDVTDEEAAVVRQRLRCVAVGERAGSDRSALRLLMIMQDAVYVLAPGGKLQRCLHLSELRTVFYSDTELGLQLATQHPPFDLHYLLPTPTVYAVVSALKKVLSECGVSIAFISRQNFAPLLSTKRPSSFVLTRHPSIAVDPINTALPSHHARSPAHPAKMHEVGRLLWDPATNAPVTVVTDPTVHSAIVRDTPSGRCVLLSASPPRKQRHPLWQASNATPNSPTE